MFPPSPCYDRDRHARVQELARSSHLIERPDICSPPSHCFIIRSLLSCSALTHWFSCERPRRCDLAPQLRSETHTRGLNSADERLAQTDDDGAMDAAQLRANTTILEAQLGAGSVKMASTQREGGRGAPARCTVRRVPRSPCYMEVV